MTERNGRYQETLDFLYRQLPMFQRIGPMAFKKDLTNIIALCEALREPQLSYPSIHIAGTNGKGSVAHMLSAVLQARGLKVGLYTSPHYRDFRERIKVNGQLAPRQYVVDFVEQHYPLFQTIQPSFFEITVAMAFDYFAKKQIDIAVVEVGLGGRLDSTNILTPVLSVITNISYDHMDLLGDTLPLIAAEKAGIIKQGVPVVIGGTHPETQPVFDAKAAEMNAPLIYADQHYQAFPMEEQLSHTVFEVLRDDLPWLKDLMLNARGPFQQYNLQTVFQAVESLRPSFSLTENDLRTGLAGLRRLTRYIGRWQMIGENPAILCDSAHNEGGLQLTMTRLAAVDYDQLHMVIGFVKDKEIDKLLALLPKHARYYFVKADIPRGLDAASLKEKAARHGLRGRAYSSVRNALRAAKRAADPSDTVFVGGSIFVVAEVV